MASDIELTASDEGKTVVNEQGDTVGKVVDVRADGAYVDPDPDVTDTIMSKLGWGDEHEDTYMLDENAVEQVTDDTVRLGPL